MADALSIIPDTANDYGYTPSKPVIKIPQGIGISRIEENEVFVKYTSSSEHIPLESKNYKTKIMHSDELIISPTYMNYDTYVVMEPKQHFIVKTKITKISKAKPSPIRFEEI